MNQILALREKRAKLWVATKEFLDTHRKPDGWLSEEDNVIYEKMESDVLRLGMEIQRLEQQAHIDRHIVMNAIKGDKKMGCTLYMVLINGVSVAQNIEIEYATIFIEALFNKYCNDKDMTVSIQRMDKEGYEE